MSWIAAKMLKSLLNIPLFLNELLWKNNLKLYKSQLFFSQQVKQFTHLLTPTFLQCCVRCLVLHLIIDKNNTRPTLAQLGSMNRPMYQYLHKHSFLNRSKLLLVLDTDNFSDRTNLVLMKQRPLHWLIFTLQTNIYFTDFVIWHLEKLLSFNSSLSFCHKHRLTPLNKPLTHVRDHFIVYFAV